MTASIQHRRNRNLPHPINRNMPHNQTRAIVLEGERDGRVLALVSRSACEVAAGALEVGQIASGGLHIECERADGYAGRLVCGEVADFSNVGAGFGEGAGVLAGFEGSSGGDAGGGEEGSGEDLGLHGVVDDG